MNERAHKIQGMKKMKCVSKTVFRAQGNERAIVPSFIAYAGTGNDVLVHGYGFLDESDTYDDFGEMISYDNGLTWSDHVVRHSKTSSDSETYRYAETTVFTDPDNGRLLLFLSKGKYPCEDGDFHAISKVCFEVCVKEFMLSKRSEKNLDSLNFDLPGGAMVSFCFPLKTSTGIILVPAMTKAVNDKGDLLIHPSGNVIFKSMLIIGRYDLSGNLIWSRSQFVEGDPLKTSRGLSENTIAELSDSRIVMVARGSNDGMPEVPGYKWVSFSSNYGKTWSIVVPLRYDNGEHVESSATGSALFRSEKTNKLYWIGNPAIDGQANGNWPRSPLAIFEVQETPFALKRDSMCIIDLRQKEDGPQVQFSNFRFFQERSSGDVLVYLSRFGENEKKWKISDYFEYRIVL